MSDLIYLQGTPKQLIPIIMQTMATYQLMENLDIDSENSSSQIDPGRKYHPLIRLHFREDTDFVKGKNQPGYHGRNRHKGRTSFRLMNETTESITEGELKRIGQRIKELFGAGNGYVWGKGKELYCYAEWDKGYQMQLLSRSQTQAQEIVTKVLSIQGHIPQWKYLTKTENIAEAERYPIGTQTKTILGKTHIIPEIRPNVEVRFKYADARVSSLSKPIIIFDRTNKKAEALVR